MSELFDLRTEYPVAFDSPDHLEPLGTKNDNSKNPKFVQQCEKLLRQRGKEKGLILDIGCAGGGCIEDFYAAHHDAWGIEGSDYSKKLKRAAWGSIPDRLHTCDASRPFEILRDGETLLFDIIYSFEVMEHMPPDRLHIYFENIHKHLADDGVFIGSFTCTKSNKHPDHHQSVMSKRQWHEFINGLGLLNIIDLKWKSGHYLRHSALKKNCIPVAMEKR